LGAASYGAAPFLCGHVFDGDFMPKEGKMKDSIIFIPCTKKGFIWPS
jgi:hypothetical protein